MSTKRLLATTAAVVVLTPLRCSAHIVSSIKHGFSELNNKPVCRDDQYDMYER